MSTAIAQGRPVPSALLGELLDSTPLRRDMERLQSRLREDGYVLVRGVVDQQTVLAARSEVFQRLEEVGEISSPAVEGIATGESRRRELTTDLGEFWRSVCTGPALRAATHGSQMQAYMSGLLGEPARSHDFMFLRPGRPGLSTRLHYDFPFFARGSDRIYTAWMALGEIPLTDGPLMVVKASNRFDDLIDTARQIDYDSAQSPTVQVMQDTVAFVQSRQTSLLTTAFMPGDVIVFDMFTMHGTLDNHSPIGRVRLSCDVRWQPASDAIDSRYVGDRPAGTTGAGYGELNGAKPLTDEWHTR